VEILRFGPGFRRRYPLAGAQGVADQLVWSDPHARVTELAFSSRALLPPQTSPDRGLLVVVAGGGWVQVGEERTVIHHGEAVELPPGVAHGAWTDGSTMRVILLEVPDSALETDHARLADVPAASATTPGRGGLAPRPLRPDGHDASEGEPW
jgi:quercetin dioxygenase-like cupin family protein